ncbi:MAG: 2-amino-4-hydroxy-6-hydroxymethyldihydropteridine diphosphokinase [Cyclobacteriaceae bacterium]|jgi:2-amino-4-hydroxy-6-hydroxymethyldihydropteridine diphosphokinase|nr:2-amino-4-hydroxy-6-hydroxymethyldihydropteridine diphosphokinase [Cyclobacteriaceae bacterium]
MNNCYILLGTNLGDKQSNLQKVIIHLENEVGRIIKSSSVFQTEPWGRSEQDVFLNQVLKIETMFNSLEVLTLSLDIEVRMGRIRKEKWMDRIIDIDILYFNQEIYYSPELVVPHPEIQNRRFTLEPLVEISPNYIHPVLNKTNKELLGECGDPLQVEILILDQA